MLREAIDRQRHKQPLLTQMGATHTLMQAHGEWWVTVMGDVEVGDGATVLPNSVLLPGSRVGAGETWGGVPARRITRDEMEAFKDGIRGRQQG